jgi:hypothetical protein
MKLAIICFRIASAISAPCFRRVYIATATGLHASSFTAYHTRI